MIPRHSAGTIEAMRPVGAFVADVLTQVSEVAKPGANLLELDAFAHDLIHRSGATSCYIDYHPQAGDLLSLDFAVSLGGWVADSALSLVVGGQGSREDQRLIDTCEQALIAGIEAAQPGNRLGDISAAIGAVSKAAGYLVNTDFGGHGVGRTMHEDPSIPNDGTPGTGPVLKPGMVFAIEPWLMHSTDEIYTAEDGWTLMSADGSRSAHVEHTVAITKNGPLVLTERS